MLPERITVFCPQPYPDYLREDVCLARLDAHGRFVLLSAGWEVLLGFSRAELHGRPLLEFVRDAAALARALIPSDPDAVRLDMRRSDGGVERMQWHRRFDPQDSTLFIVGEPLVLSARLYRAPVLPNPA
jgi:hypothetical protein